MSRLVALIAPFLLLLAPAAFAEDDHPRPFDENYDAMPVVDAALESARTEDKRLLLILGADWCHDSRGLAHHLEDSEVAATLAEHYVTRFIDVGWRDRNQAVARRFGVPAVYATPTVLVIDPHEERLLNRAARGDWTSAASRPVEEARRWFGFWAEGSAPTGGVMETSLVYQAMMLEIDLYEEDQATRLAAAYRDIGRWRDLPADERPSDFAALEQEVETWRRTLSREIDTLRAQARRLVSAELSDRAGGAPVTSETVAAMDADDPDLSLDFAPHTSARW